VCEFVNVRYESDYFGLKYENHKGEESWLNLRNPIDRQVTFHGHPPCLRLSLRVKFWVPPHILQQESTRHQFYLNARLHLLEKRLTAPDWDSISRLIAFIAQSECGDFNELDPARNIYNLAASIAPLSQSEKPNDLLQRIVHEHKKCSGMKSSSAEYWFLKEVSEFENFGEETFTVKNHHNNNTVFGIGPHGITMYKKEGEKELISFTNITSASSHKRTFKLEYLTIDNEVAILNIKLDSSHLASSLYRAITEKHAFYSCETVRSAVTAQFIRDLKGTIVSIFNEDSTLGKKYVFDIRRTCREVYDNARRALYQENTTQNLSRGNLDHNQNGGECKNSQEKLSRFLDAMTCKICMDSQIDAIFLPCGHGVACTACASRCDRCPLCRSDIAQAQKVFLPIELQQLLLTQTN
jgi:E3 ubiquitin-protein ligase MYLIP